MAPRSFADIAAKAAREPYVLEMPDGTSVSIAQPTVAQWAEVSVSTSLKSFLVSLGVDEDGAEMVQAAIMPAPLGTADALVADIRNYFGLGN